MTSINLMVTKTLQCFQSLNTFIPFTLNDLLTTQTTKKMFAFKLK
jgi:hypothetical protein